MATISNEMLERIVQSADEAGVRLQLTAGVPTWEAMPGFRHQRIARKVADSARRTFGSEGDCGCHTFLDVVIRFPDGSFRSPDVAIYGQEPPDVDGAGEAIPVAVIEIVSEGYELKDRIGLPFYLAQGIADVVLYDPRIREIVHATVQGESRHVAPMDLNLACGCTVSVPL